MKEPILGQCLFGPFRLDVSNHSLVRMDGVVPEDIHLKGREFDILLFLILNAGKIVSPRDLMLGVWGKTFVEENNVSKQVSNVRKALGDRKNEWYVETVRNRGYRFRADVEVEWLDEETQVEFGKLGTLHVHVDGSDAGHLVRDVVRQLNEKFPDHNRVSTILHDEPGPQREKKPETYGLHTPGGLEKQSKLKYFSTHLFGGFSATKRELRRLLSALHDSGVNEKDIVIEAERVIGKINNQGGTWRWVDTFLPNYPPILSADIGYEMQCADSVEVHFGLDIPKKSPSELEAPISCAGLLEMTKSLEIEVGGWFQFAKEPESIWAFRSNMFEESVDREKIDSDYRALSTELARKARTEGFDWNLKAVVEHAVGIWQIPLTKCSDDNDLVTAPELAQWEATYPNLKEFWVVAPNFLGDKNEEIQDAMIRNLTRRDGQVSYTYFLRSISDYKRLQGFVRSLTKDRKVGNAEDRIRAILVIEDLSSSGDMKQVFREGGCFIANPLSDTDDADGYALINSQNKPGEIDGARPMEYDHMQDIISLLKPLTAEPHLQGLNMSLSAKEPVPIIGAIVCLEVAEIPTLTNEIEEKTSERNLNDYDLTLASVVSRLGGRVVRIMEKGYVIIFKNPRAGLPFAREIQARANEMALSQKVAIDFGEAWKVMRAHGIDYCGRQIARCRHLLTDTSYGEIRLTGSFLDKLPAVSVKEVVRVKGQGSRFDDRAYETFIVKTSAPKVPRASKEKTHDRSRASS